MRASSPCAIVMVSTRLTGSSTSITSASIRSAAVDRRLGPRRARTTPPTKARVGSPSSRCAGATSAATPASSRSKNASRVGVEPVAVAPRARRVPVVAAEHLVGALAGLHDLAVARDLLAEQVEGDRVVGDHRLAHRRDRRGQRVDQPVGADADLVVVRAELARHRSENANSSPSRSPRRGKPIENVASSRWPRRGRAARRSARSPARRRAARRPGRRRPSAARPPSRSASSSASSHSSAAQSDRAGSRVNGGSHQRRSRRVPSGSRTSTRRGRELARRRAGSCAAAGRWSARRGSGAARPGRRPCRRRRRPRSAGSVDAKRRRAVRRSAR